MNRSKRINGIIDASPSGVSGDKYLGALIDMGGKLDSLRKVAKTVARILPGASKIDVQVNKVDRGDIAAQLVTVTAEEDVEERKGSTIRLSAQKAATKLGLSVWGRELSISIVDELLDAESQVHGRSNREVHLHELSSADTLVDILGTAYLLEQLDLSAIEWWSSPIAVGQGTTRFSGLKYSVPPPAVAEILRKHRYPMFHGPDQGELSTPTGVAITVNLAPKRSNSYPTIRPARIGYGAGSRELQEVANVLRLMTGENVEGSHSHDQMVVLETNLDDVSGEVIGRAVETLMQNGARDVSVTPVFMKKNRPGHIVSVIADRDRAEILADVLINETGTFGVREFQVSRHISARTTSTVTIQVNGSSFEAQQKSSISKSGRVLNSKLEYEDLRRISRETGRSIREIQNIAKPTLQFALKKGRQSLK